MVSHRNDTIDAFRGIAVAGVIAHHYTGSRGDDFLGVPEYSSLFQLGTFGVHLFFVVSGLVIAMTVERSATAADFGVRRFARLWPAFAVAATLTFLSMHAFGPEIYRVSVRDYLATLTMVAPKLGATFVDGVYWTLLPEIKFYGYTALSFLVLGKRYWFGLAVVGLLGLLARPFTPGVADTLLGVEEMPFFLTGMAAYLWLYAKTPVPAAATGVVGATLFATLPSTYFRAYEQPSLTLHVGLGVAVALMLLAIAIRVSFWRLLPWLGRISYSLYLLHNRLGMTFIQYLRLLGLPDVLAILMGVVSAVALAWGFYRLVEIPGQRLVLEAWSKLRARAQRETVTD